MEQEQLKSGMKPHTIKGKQVGNMLKYLKQETKGPQEAAALLIATYMELMQVGRKDNPSTETIVEELAFSIKNFIQYQGEVH